MFNVDSLDREIYKIYGYFILHGFIFTGKGGKK